jgi:hypothetical protein
MQHSRGGLHLSRRRSFACFSSLTAAAPNFACVLPLLQETVAGFEVRCCASQRLHQARRGVNSCVQAAAAAHVAGGRDIWKSAENGNACATYTQRR